MNGRCSEQPRGYGQLSRSYQNIRTRSLLQEELVLKSHVSMLLGRPQIKLRGLGLYNPFCHGAPEAEWFTFGILFLPADIPR